MDQRANLVTRLRKRKVTVGFDNLAREFKTGDVRCPGRRRILAQALHHIRTVDPRGADFNQDLPRTGRRHPGFNKGQNFGSARFFYDYVFHFRAGYFQYRIPDSGGPRRSLRGRLPGYYRIGERVSSGWTGNPLLPTSARLAHNNPESYLSRLQ